MVCVFILDQLSRARIAALLNCPETGIAAASSVAQHRLGLYHFHFPSCGRA